MATFPLEDEVVGKSSELSLDFGYRQFDPIDAPAGMMLRDVLVLLEKFFGECHRTLQMLHRLSNALTTLRHQLLHQREELVADLITQGIVLGIGAVGDIGQTIIAEVGEDLLTRQTEERTHYLGGVVAGNDASEAMDAGAAHEVHEECFDTVISVVSERNETILLVPPFVAQLTGSHLE